MDFRLPSFDNSLFVAALCAVFFCLQIAVAGQCKVNIRSALATL